MAEEENGGIVKKEFDEDEHVRKIGNNMKGISIAERRGFNNADVTCLGSPYVTIPSGISPSALLDSPMVLLPNAQAQLSPTTGTFHQFPLSPSPDTLNLKLNLANENNDTIEPINDNLTFEEYFEYQETRNVDTLAKSDNARISTNNNINQDQSKQYHQKASYVPKEVAKHSEDGFYWRKYGQKHVKGSEFPRSYYKCTNANCLVKKKVERSHAGEITQIVYKGSHNHPTPQPLNNNRRPNEFGPDHPWKPDNNGCLVGEINSSASILGELPDHQPPVETQDISSNTFGSGDGEDRRNQASPESISCKDEDDENNNAESEPKKRKRGNVPDTETSIPRSGRESKVVVQIESEVDILDDGYRWRKYGQKVVKGNPNPRSYYKCTTPRCPVRKHVERAADDIKSVLTTYEGKHNHDVPASKAAAAGGGSFPAAVSGDNLNQKPEHSSKAGKQAQVVDNNYHHLPMYMERKQQQQPILSYNDFMRSSLAGHHHHHHHDLGFGSIFPYSFPPFPSLAAYNSLLMNGNENNNHVKPFYMSMPMAQMNLGFNNLYAAPPNPTDRMRECEVVKPKEEQAEDEGESSYDHTCLQQSIPNHGNGSL